jgi:ribosomal protein L24E
MTLRFNGERQGARLHAGSALPAKLNGTRMTIAGLRGVPFERRLGGSASHGTRGRFARRSRRVVGAVGVVLGVGIGAPSYAASPGNTGYWTVRADGATYPFGSASTFVGPASIIRGLRAPIKSVAATPDGKGIWMVASDGGVFAFGDAKFFGSAANINLAAPIVGMAATRDGGGYWLVASDGGVFAYGDASFSGSVGGQGLPQPMVGIAASS